MAELALLFPGGAGGGAPRVFFSFPNERLRRTNDGMHDLRGNAQSQAHAGVAASNHRPLITSDPYKHTRPWGAMISAKRNNLLLRRLRPGPELMAAIYMRHSVP
jgi:hypothetical protein